MNTNAKIDTERMLEKLDKARAQLSERNIVVFTSDVDWASEYAIDQTLGFFQKRSLPLTVFVTHDSQVLKRAMSQGKIKCGIHPNFMPGSSQGDSYDEVIDFCFDLIPNARCFRSHRYYEVNDTMETLCRRGIEFESNVCSLLDVVPPFLHRSRTVSFPIFWEDGAYLFDNDGFYFNSFLKRLLLPGLKVINIHPMHLMLNTPYFSYTRQIKDSLSREDWNQLSEKSIERLRCRTYGITDFIREITDAIQQNHIESMFLEDTYDWILSL